MGMTLNRLYKLSNGNQSRPIGLIVIGGTGTTLYGSQAIPSAFTDMVDCNGAAMAAGLHSFVVLPEYVILDGDATSVQIIGASLQDTGVDIEQPA